MQKEKHPFKASNPKMQPLFDKWKVARDALFEVEVWYLPWRVGLEAGQGVRQGARLTRWIGSRDSFIRKLEY
jgi:hypothetical protein